MEQKELVIFESEDQAVSLKVPIEEETVWLTQAQMTRLFSVDRTVITRHVNNVFRDEELDEKSNVHFLHIANSDKPVKFYSLDVIISVGYRVKSKRGIEFRRWANKVLKDYILKGYAVNHNRISQLGEVIKIMKQRKYRGNLPNIRRVRSLSYTGGKSCESALFSDEESLIFGWK